jgi:hypothetical protein
LRRNETVKAAALRAEDPQKYTQEVLGTMLGVAQNTVSTWFATNITVDISCEQLSDARVRVPKAHRRPQCANLSVAVRVGAVIIKWLVL